MTGFGKIYDLLSNDSDSKVNFYNVPDSAPYSAFTSHWEVSGFPTYTPREPIAYCSDDAGEREIAILNKISGVFSLDVHTVDFDAQTITLSSTTTFTASSAYLFHSINKVGSLYNIYYVYGTGTTLYFKKIVITPGVGFSDEAIDDVSVSDTYMNISNYAFSNKVFYLGVLGLNNVAPFRIYIYTFDIVSETVGGGVEYSSVDAQYGYYYNSQPIAFGVSNGAVTWASFVVRYTGGFTRTAHFYIIINGSETYIGDGTNVFPGDSGAGLMIFRQYNKTDWLLQLECLHINKFGAGVYRYFDAFLTSGGSLTTSSPSTYDIWPTANNFNSPQYCAIVRNGDDDLFYYVDVTTGEATTQVLPDGVSKIYDIYQKTDDGDNSMYMGVKLTDNSYATIGVDLNTLQLKHTFPETVNHGSYAYPNYRGCFNHGNFFIHWIGDDVTMYVTYIFGNAGSAIIFSNVCQMIIEHN
jgi:hypothetical protein